MTEPNREALDAQLKELDRKIEERAYEVEEIKEKNRPWSDDAELVQGAIAMLGEYIGSIRNVVNTFSYKLEASRQADRETIAHGELLIGDLANFKVRLKRNES